jgi:WD40 repeat protein
MAGYETAIVRLRSLKPGQPTAGLGLLISSTQLVTCAHVVNTALGRGPRVQEPPGESERVLVEFPQLAPGHVWTARTVASAWAPPPATGMAGGDIAGLILEQVMPADAAPARFAAAVPEPGTSLRVFGYPGEPAREDGAWVDVDLKGEIGELIQVESRGAQTIKAQPGYSGSPVWNHSTGEAVGLLKAAPFADKPERDAYLIKPFTIAHAWEEPFDYLLVPETPYRGLEPFSAEHAAEFFGRDIDIGVLTARVRAQPVVVVVGPSGVGKSSLVMAGLVPALRRQRQWSVALVRPGQDPWPRLAAGLVRAHNGLGAVVTLDEAQRESDRLRAGGFGPMARFLRGEDRPLLVVVDQLEELLATTGGPDQDLLDLLLPEPDAAVEACRLVLTLRADFLPVLQSIPGFHARLNERLYLLSPLTAEQMREAIVRPAAARGVAFRGGLVDQILDDAAGGSLPVLEFTLAKLWETQRRKALTLDGYQQIGGVRGVLDRFAEEKIDKLTGAAAGVLDRVLLRLVRTSGGPDLAVRQRVFRDKVSVAEWEVVQRLAEARLVIADTDGASGEPYAELAHESLITAWHRLHSLVSENADFLTWLAKVEQRAADGDLLPEARIAEARNWLDTRPDDVPAAVRTFIESSETVAETRLRELRDARDRAEALRLAADDARDRAEALRLAADAELALRTAPRGMTLSLALAVESVLTMPTMQGDRILRMVLQLHPWTLIRLDHDHGVNAVAFSPDGARLATGSGRSDRGSARVFDVATGVEQARLDHDNEVYAMAFSPNGTKLATGSGNLLDGGGAARVFDVATGVEQSRLDDRYVVWAVAFSPDGTRVAIACGRLGYGWARVFDAATGAQQAQLDHGNVVNAVMFSPDGTRVATASDDGWARIFDVATWGEQARLDHGDSVNALVFSPDGALIATGSGDSGSGSARVFDVATGAQQAQLDHGPVRAVAFSPDSTRVATASDDGSARVFDAATGAQLARFDHDSAVQAVAFSPDGVWVATGGKDGSARVFDAATGAQLARFDHDSAVQALAPSPDSVWVATGSEDGSARVFETAPEAEQSRLYHDDAVWAVAFSPDGSRVATASHDHSARLFDAASGRELARLNHAGIMTAVVFSPDGGLVATASLDKSARVFEAATGVEQARLDHDDAVWAVAFSPDGTRIATGSGDILTGGHGSMGVFDAATGAERTRVDHAGPVWTVTFSPDGTWIATGSGTTGGRYGAAWVFDAATGAKHAGFRHDDAVKAVAFSPDGYLIATASQDGAVRVFDVATRARQARFPDDYTGSAVTFSPDPAWIATRNGTARKRYGSARFFDAAHSARPAWFNHDGPVGAVAFSPDGYLIATASEDGSVRVFDTATRTQQARFDHDGPVFAVVFSPDGTRIATASGDGSARVFDAATGVERSRLYHDGSVFAVAFSPDGTRVVTASGDSLARVFEVTPDLLIEHALDVMSRPLNPAELRRYSLTSSCRHTKEWERRHPR